MLKCVVNGSNKLYGDVRVQGSKNASLPILAAAILCEGETVIHNIPDITDIGIMLNLLRELGCKVTEEGKSVIINSMELNCMYVRDELVAQMRSSIIILGALLSRGQDVKISYPGGCSIGLRPIDLHLKALKKLGADIREENGYIFCKATRLKGADISLDFPSVGATENIILASATAEGTCVIRNAAKEPEIIDLQGYLNACGARVSGAGTDTVTVTGVPKLRCSEYTIMADRIAAGTYMAACHMTGGDVFLRGVTREGIGAIYDTMLAAGADMREQRDGLRISSDGRVKPIDKLTTMPYPGFPTDMQPQISTMLCVADGVSIVKETIFENRFRHIVQLLKMGADITTEGNTAIIKGVSHLYGARVYAEDLRAGAALIIAALRAEGQSEIYGVNYILRGYDDIDGTLRALGADIKIVENIKEERASV